MNLERSALIIDDSLDDRRVIRRHLNRDTRYNYKIVEASSGAEGLEAVRLHRPDVVILDQILGDMRGTEVLQALRAEGFSDLPIVVLSGSADDGVDPLELGADDCLNKEEVSGAYLRRAISNAFTKARMRALLEQKESSLKAALREVERRMEFEARLIGVVSHDLRTPLGAVGLGVEALLDEPQLTQEGRQVLGRVARSTEHVISMVTQLFDLTRIRQSGSFPIEAEASNLADVVKDRVVELSVGLPERAIRFVSEGNCAGFFDPTALGQVAHNLINNAIKHGDSTRSVEVYVGQVPTGLLLRVKNWGPPIPAATRERLFEPFVRGTTAGSGGLGLGLFIAKEIAAAHHAEISVFSEGDETAFEMALPLRGISA